MLFLMQAYIPGTGRGVQGATSHCLGQNFAKMFDIQFEDEEGKRKMVWQNSWGLTTRTVSSHKYSDKEDIYEQTYMGRN